ncbi:hypothetical protein KIL84_021074, partial [Mauremys mutica]
MVAAYLHQRDIHVYAYLEGWLFRGCSGHQVQAMVNQTLFNTLGLKLSEEMSVVLPLQRIEFRGVVLDSASARAFLLLSRFQTLQDLCVPLKDHPQTTERNRLRLLGHMTK